MLGCPEMFLEQTLRRLGLRLVEQDRRKIDLLSPIRPQQTAFAGVPMSGENDAISASQLDCPRR